jgi:hypothetical protein
LARERYSETGVPKITMMAVEIRVVCILTAIACLATGCAKFESRLLPEARMMRANKGRLMNANIGSDNNFHR